MTPSIHRVLICSSLFLVSCGQTPLSGSSAKMASHSADSTKTEAIEDQIPQKVEPGHPEPYVDISALPKNESIKNDGGPTPGGDSNSAIKQTAYGLECESSKTMEFAPKEPHGSKYGVVLTGQFCQSSANDLYILFIVDNSASMGKHFSGVLPKNGNDPQVKDDKGLPTCGRLRGAKAILKKFQDPGLAHVKTRIGVLSFASRVIEAKEIKEPNAPITESLVSDKIFCETINQPGISQPGGIFVPGISFTTNYEDALLKAKDVLKNIPGQKLIYFITDGEPTNPGSSAFALAKAIEAANKLRTEVKDLTINAVFLNADNPNKAKETLGQITADPKRVLLAANPDEIAAKIVEFPPVGFVASSLKASLLVSPYPEEPIAAEFTQHPTKNNVWIYKTKPFLLLGKPGEIVDNIVKVGAKALDGSNIQTTVTVKFTMPP
jgi:hypothetical protein